MSNPMISRLTSRQTNAASAASHDAVMTHRGTAGKALILLTLCAFSASLAWRQVGTATSDEMMLTMGIGLVGGLLAALIVSFRPNTAPVIAPVYAVLEGLFLGVLSAMIERAYPGVPQQAMLLTFAVALVVFALYRNGLLQATTRFRRTVLAAALGILLFYAAQIVLAMLHIDLGINLSTGPLALVVNLVTAGVAALFLVLDFDAIDKAVAGGAPRRMEWYGAFALMLTLVWLYLELLQLLGEGE